MVSFDSGLLYSLMEVVVIAGRGLYGSCWSLLVTLNLTLYCYGCCSIVDHCPVSNFTD